MVPLATARWLLGYRASCLSGRSGSSGSITSTLLALSLGVFLRLPLCVVPAGRATPPGDCQETRPEAAGVVESLTAPEQPPAPQQEGRSRSPAPAGEGTQAPQFLSLFFNHKEIEPSFMF